ncbi:unnamed protein product [Amoebophrya sp. A120]|nr:unnamed protein product [Amoebophrya sp. A120]|eukprot:GSA120T00012993001.1
MSESGAKNVVVVELHGPSAAYGAWVERRLAGFLLQQQENHQANVEARRRNCAEADGDRAKTVQTLQQATAEAKRCAEIEIVMMHHKACVEASRRGWLCTENLKESFDDIDFTAWIFGKPFPHDQHLPQSREAGMAGQPRVEKWEHLGEPRKLQISQPSYRGYISGNYMKGLSESLVQDQLRVWMTAVRRRFLVKTHMPPFPSELFLKVRSFMRPLGSVILNPLYLAEIATRKRQCDIEPLLGAAISSCFSDLRKNKASGRVWWTRDAKETGVPDRVSVGVSLGSRIFTIQDEASQMWPAKSEDYIIDRQDTWEKLRQKQIADKWPFVRPVDQEGAKYASLMGILREFFESKGLKFSQDEEDRSKFEISWG